MLIIQTIKVAHPKLQTQSTGTETTGLQSVSKCNPSAAQIQITLETANTLPLSPMEYVSN